MFFYICLVPYFRSLRIVRNIHIDHNASFLFCGAHDRGRGVGTGPGCTKCRIAWCWLSVECCATMLDTYSAPCSLQW
ncbi:hypothetical protein PISMIDRAFT_233583 [Pisolithus microcarpus 441]|uniref:Uncharacterized protein n=1 Tax=Pisolithus microcarpus 441 TaxID=765257 RepID=A0A0C9XXD4_9AGAM|nr:hypothetical protein PISMIDRAFT_233583 [Pisolithus microcarpus 441]